ncbi:putative sulfate exporter family transporter, partial [Cellulomonas sp. 179-A 4D5 NHS]|uniref:putative sulfate exporter family transporter n=1 Tax=Cellulomonas sp. 179-A 4D5 NHS TaxID=3142378 RepID=UPI0039A08A73
MPAGTPAPAPARAGVPRTSPATPHPAPPAAPARLRTLAPGLLAVAALTAACLLAAGALPTVSPLLLAIVVGAVARNAGLLPDAVRPGVAWAARHPLRAGVVLLGLQLSVPAVRALRPGEVVLVVVTVAATFTATRWAGARLGVDRRTTLLLATGFSICGAAAVAAMSAAVPASRPAGTRTIPGTATRAATGTPDVTVTGTTTDPDRPDAAVATAVAMVTVFGSLALVAMPLAQAPLGLDDRQVGVWIGASVHEVAQVVAAASGVSAAALAVAVVVKLARVALLAPLVAVVGALEHRRERARTAAAVPAADG